MIGLDVNRPGTWRVIAATTLMAAVGCSGTHSADTWIAPHSWPQYGFDADNSQNNPRESRLGADDLAQLHEHWRLRMPGGATATPVIADGSAYFGAWNGHMYAVDAESGELRWDRRLTSALIRSTALVSGDRVYVGAGAALFALDRTSGETQFESKVDAHPDTGIDASPKLIDGLVIIGVAHYENTGPKDDYTSIGAVVAFDADSGNEVWRTRTTGDEPGTCTGGAGASVWSSAAIDPRRGLLYVGTGQSYEAPASTCSDSLLAIHYARDFAGDDRIAWRQQYTQGDVYAAGANVKGADADIGASPNLFEAAGRALVGVGDKGGSYRVFDRDTGEPVWRKDLAIGTPPVATAVGGVMTTAAVSGDTLYVASNQFRSLSWIKDDQLVPDDTGMLYALDTATGEERWSVALAAPMIGSLTIAGGVLYHPLIDGKLYARELATGAELWSTSFGASLGAAPSIVDARVYVSAGFVMNGAQSVNGGAISGFGLEDRASTIRDAAPDQLEPLDAEQCKAALDPDIIPSADCGDCLCACDATAAGHCESCFSLAPCTVMSCATTASGDGTRACLAEACGAKLLPTYLFDRAVDVAACVVQCKDRCGL